MSKINLPELPPEVDPVRALFRGQPDHFEAQDYYYTQEQMRAYAEQAVREALEAAAQSLEPMAQEAFERPEVARTVHMAYHQAIQSIRSLIPENDHGEST